MDAHKTNPREFFILVGIPVFDFPINNRIRPERQKTGIDLLQWLWRLVETAAHASLSAVTATFVWHALAFAFSVRASNMKPRKFSKV